MPFIIIYSDGKQHYKPKKIEFQNPLHIAGETLFTLVDRSARILLDKKQIEFSGDTYIPEECIEDYNEEFDTDYEPNMVEFDL